MKIRMMKTCLWLVIWGVVAGVPFTQPAQAVKSYPVLLDRIAYEAREILRMNGLPVQHDRRNPWEYISGGPESYTLYLFLADEIPKAAKIETIQYMMDLYEERGRKIRFRIWMYHETLAEQMRWFSGVKPFFKMSIGDDT